MDETMRAAVLEGPGKIAVKDVPMPEIGEDDVLIRVVNCGICGSDIHSFKTGMYVEPGQVMGHEFMGHISQVGSQVEGIAVGDRVTGFSASVCGECDACKREQFILCSKLFTGSTGYGLPGAFAEYVKIENAQLGANVHKLPDAIDNVSAAMIEPVSVGVAAAAEANVRPGDRVVVLGVGMIGNACLQAAKAAGASEVIAVDVSPTRLEIARQSGADDVFDARDGDATEWVKQKFGIAPYHYNEGGNADVVFEAAGIALTIRQSLEMVRPGGTICIVGLPEHAAEIDTTKIVHKMPKIVGSLGGDFVPAIAKLASGAIKVKHLMTHSFPLEEAAEAFAVQLRAGEAVKVMITAGEEQATPRAA
ncbi:zinc-binding dehydrogenase [Sphingopyxis sp. J-6]|uniref:zinc-dependent alcohol dehydrogenase n=1 Tax=Sphingopyxis sp. J-6 TaxID=3122054 RepID=UPI0039842E37